MVSTSFFRLRRRSAGERHALAGVARKIQASDRLLRRKYLRDYNQAFNTYRSLLSSEQLASELLHADILLIGDYHALPASQHFAVEVLQTIHEGGKTPTLGLEAIFASDQDLLKEWQRQKISDSELRQRLHFDFEWGYEWAPMRELLLAARKLGSAVYGLDCAPRHDLRTITARDRHTAEKIAEMRKQHPESPLVALLGESHLAPTHLPELLRRLRPQDRILTVLQNKDALYWRATAKVNHNARAVRVGQDVVCVFTASPLEKYESYRLCLERWQQERRSGGGFGPTFYNLLDALSKFLNIPKYSCHNGSPPMDLMDSFPEVRSENSIKGFHKYLLRREVSAQQSKESLAQLEERGSCYISQCNTILVQRLDVTAAAEDVSRFLHRACRKELFSVIPAAEAIAPGDVFYATTVEHALAYLGSRILNPARPARRERDLYEGYNAPPEEIERENVYSYREHMQMIDFLILHKDFEQNARQYHHHPALINEGIRYSGSKFAYATEQLGQMLGTQLFDAYVEGRISKQSLRALFFKKLKQAGSPQKIYFDLVAKLRCPSKRLAA